MPTPTPDQAEGAFSLYTLLKDFSPGLISLFALCIGFKNQEETAKNAKSNIKLQAKIDQAHSKERWREEKIYNIADELNDLAADYWLNGEVTLETKKAALSIKVRLSDLEENASVIGLDITNEVKFLQDLITGGDFESSDRKPLSPCHDKFISIRQNTQQVKTKLAAT